MSGEPATNKIKAYYDGQCPMCAGIMDSVRNSTKCDDFVLQDMHKTKSLPFGKGAIEKEIHVIDQDGKTHRGAQAIFRIAEQYPHLQLATRIARTPLARALAPPAYGFVAANRRFLVGPASRVFWLKTTIILAFCIGLVMSSRLWVGPRSYPETPVSSLLPPIDGLAAYGLFAALFGLALAVLSSPRPQKYITALLAIIVVYCLLDQSRWQPWVFQYGFLLTTLALFSWKSDDIGGLKRTLNIARLIVASTYVYSGLQKLNANFVEFQFPFVVQPITDAFPSTTNALHLVGMGVPYVQVAFGIGLLTKRLRRLSLILAVSMHVFVLAMFGPAGLDWNSIVWPWTAAMGAFDILLFAGKTEFSMREIIWTKGHRFHTTVFAIFALLPLLSFVNLWDSYLSSALYSGNITDALIYTTDAGKNSLPAAISRYVVHASPDTNVLNVERWAIEDLNVTPYPETRVYKQIARNVCDQSHDPSQLVLTVKEQRMFFSRPEASYRCSQL